MTVRYHNANFTKIASLTAWRAERWRRLLALMLFGGVIIGGYQVHLILQPGKAIRHDLIHAARAVSRLPWSTPPNRVRQMVSGYFADYRASVDASGFPAHVTVTLNDLGRRTCRDAYQEAGRIDGAVVIVAEGRADEECHDAAAITWRIMP
jgi:hypothetical protein